jgi:hypothetical protein
VSVDLKVRRQWWRLRVPLQPGDYHIEAEGGAKHVKACLLGTYVEGLALDLAVEALCLRVELGPVERWSMM